MNPCVDRFFSRKDLFGKPDSSPCGKSGCAGGKHSWWTVALQKVRKTAIFHTFLQFRYPTLEPQKGSKKFFPAKTRVTTFIGTINSPSYLKMKIFYFWRAH